VSSETVRSGNASKTGKALKWVAVNTPEARAMQERARNSSGEVQGRVVQDNSVRLTTAEEVSRAISFKKVKMEAGTVGSGTATKSDSLLTPIPSVMPRYSRVQLTAGGEDLGLDAINLDGLDGLEASGTETGNAVDTGNVVDGPLAMPAEDELNAEIVPAEDTSDMEIPGAIGNENGESMLEQGGLNQNTNMSDSGIGLIPDDGNVESVQDQLPMVQVPQDNGVDDMLSAGAEAESGVAPGNMPGSSMDSLPNKMPEAADVPDMVPLDSPLLPDTTTESLSRRQVKEEDYDMPCESSEPMHRITEITNDIELHDDKIVPKSCPLSPEGETFPVREFAGTNFTWTASNLCHNPLYFEQPALERYGHTIGPLQPVLSGAQFLATIPAMPMLMAIDPPNECQYALGYYRPGSCAPRKWSPLPYSTRGAIVEGGVATALVFLIP
ncbi:MAG: hypothetical protein Q4C70_08935, partial [Planctomycetia bacterium]|nr:hypothetical protein [Planctomycetia bacterium]